MIRPSPFVVGTSHQTMKPQAKIRLRAAVAAAIVMLANTSSVSSFTSFATFYQTSSVDKRLAFASSINEKNHDLPMRQSFTLKSPSALNMAEAEEKDYISPMRQRQYS